MRYESSAGSQGLCPPGWHIPVPAEWDLLVSAYNGPGQAAGPLKDPWLANGFHSLQEGFFYQNNLWAFTAGTIAGTMYWTSAPSGADRAVARGLNAYHYSVSRYPARRNDAFTVRCVKD
jgi:uncharacterized protein (TIGR02145 family)